MDTVLEVGDRMFFSVELIELLAGESGANAIPVIVTAIQTDFKTGIKKVILQRDYDYNKVIG